jgi:transposase
MASVQRNRTKEQYWRGHLEAWRRSGQSVRGYCRDEGLSEPSFYAWRRVLAERRGRKNSAASVSVSPFVPVRLVEEAASGAAVEVVVRGGRVVRVAAGFAAQTLREVVVALEDLPC